MKNNIRTLTIIITLILTTSNLFAQEQILIDKGLAIVVNPPGRRSLAQVDLIENQLVKGTWSEPAVGQTIEGDTSNAKWKEVEVNKEGWFADRSLRGSYIYYKYESPEDKIMLLEGKGYYNVFINGEPRIGNIYGRKDDFAAWEPNFDFSFLPIEIKKGKNEFLFQASYGKIKAILHEVKSSAFFNTKDLTVPDVFKNESFEDFGGLIVVNAQNKTLTNVKIKTITSEGIETTTNVPAIIPVSVRKVRFDFKGTAGSDKNLPLTVQLISDGEILDEAVIKLRCVDKLDAYKQTFVSDIDGSVQYYAVKASTNTDPEDKQALFLSVHGASVEAINQAGSYSNKSWGHIVAPTNRRPYGFNWEDIGRLDALEVLNIAKKKFNIDENRVYLTGHSMGGHGTWHIGANYPDQFAAIGPSAGWISMWSYRYRNRDTEFNDDYKLFTRAAKQSDTYTLATNYAQLGVYIIHGDADSVVSPSQAKSMIRKLETFHKDFDYHFEPGKEHWWDIDTVRPGADCVDWRPLFDFYARHSRSLNRIQKINFTTAAPNIASKNYWVAIEQQEKQFDFSNIDVEFVPNVNLFRVKTDNVKTFSINTKCLGLEEGTKVEFSVNDKVISNSSNGEKIFLKNEEGKWLVKDELESTQKQPQRYGSFKDLFRDNVVFVYGTNGSKEENKMVLVKARYDAEMFWYNGNGSIEVIADKDFDLAKYPNSNILLFGNSDQNSAYQILLNNCPITVTNTEVKINDKAVSGEDLACYFVYPRKGTGKNLVGVIAGTGIEGGKLTYMRPFLKPGASFPDVTVFNSKILTSKENGLSAVGFFGLDWSVENGEFIFD
ncbi:MAG: prolyl oligopeptidase family serine peptidase [Bacteroidota bacterium]